MKTDCLIRFFEKEDRSAELFSPEYPRPVHLNRTGTVVWRVFAAGGNEEAAVGALAETFPEISLEKLRADVENFRNEMKKNGFLREN